MSQHSIAQLALVAFACSVAAVAHAKEIHTQFVPGELSTCQDGRLGALVPTVTYWANPYAGAIYIRKIRAWHGVSLGARADVNMNIEASHPGFWPSHHTLIAHAWDHYAEPAGINDNTITLDLGSDHVTLRPGEWLTFTSSCAKLKSGNWQHLMNAVVYYVTEPPQ